MLDLGKEDNRVEGQDLAGRFDTVVALNVIEHIRDDAAAVRNCFRLLRPGGRLVMLVPAYPRLFNGIDEELGHFRRYKKKDAACLLEGQGFRLIHSEYFNAAAIVGWWVSGALLRMRRLGKRGVTIYNYFVPLARPIDRVLGRRIGVSVIVVGERGSG
jgi:SAM-dependent methyltransferase